MQSADYWRLCDDISIFQAVMLILGYDPANLSSYFIEQKTLPHGYSALKVALSNVVKTGKIESSKVELEVHDYYGAPQEGNVDTDRTIISVKSLKEFLIEKWIGEGFFFPEGGILEGYLDPQNHYFAPKLSAAVHAWKHITNNPELLNGKTPKQALEKWLRENASTYGLTKDDGKPNETGIQEICKIANWKLEGGAAKTPTHTPLQDNSPTTIKKLDKLKIYGAENTRVPACLDDFEDEVPF